MTVFREKELPIIYPSSDGKRMADNTVQFNWLVKIKQGLEKTTKNERIFVAGDLLWYPVEGNNKMRLAPDVLVAVGRPKGDRGSYMQWREDNIPPQIVIEILSPGNRKKEMTKKLAFYERYGVEEYLIYNPMRHQLSIYERKDNKLVLLSADTREWRSSFLDFSLGVTKKDLTFYHPDGASFKSHLELDAERETAIEATKIAKEATKIANEATKIANEATRIANEATKIANQNAKREKKEKLLLAQKLRKLGVNPDDLLK